MKATFQYIFIFTFISSTAIAQDLIVTQEGDTINAKITKIKPEMIYFSFKHKEEFRNTMLPLTSVKTHQQGFFETSEVPEDKIVGYDKFQQFIVTLYGGSSTLTAEVSDDVPEDFKNYTEDLKKGSHFGFDATYYWSESLGVGLKYHQFGTSGRLNNIYVIDNTFGNERTGILSDDISISFIGPFFSTRFVNSKNNAFLINLSIGSMSYTNVGHLVDPIKIEGSTAGFSYDIGYNHTIAEKLSLVARISSISGIVDEITVESGGRTQTVELDNDTSENLGRVDLSVGLSYIF